MSTMQNSEMLLGLTANSTPNVSEVVQLFEGMSVKLQLKNIVRVIYSKHGSEPLNVGLKPSRFSSLAKNRNKIDGTMIKVLYGALTIDTAIYETLVRNRFDLNPLRLIDSKDYMDRSVISFSTVTSQGLNLLDLTQGKATCYGVPTDVMRSSQHSEGQNFSQFVFDNMSDVDGFIYTSRFTEGRCVALYYSKVIAKLT